MLATVCYGSHYEPSGCFFMLLRGCSIENPARWQGCCVSWRISNTMEAVFCVDCLEDAIRTHGKPEIFNSYQGGSQFTSETSTGVLQRENITISMDGGAGIRQHLRRTSLA